MTPRIARPANFDACGALDEVAAASGLMTVAVAQAALSQLHALHLTVDDEPPGDPWRADLDATAASLVAALRDVRRLGRAYLRITRR